MGIIVIFLPSDGYLGGRNFYRDILFVLYRIVIYRNAYPLEDFFTLLSNWNEIRRLKLIFLKLMHQK